MGAETSPKTPLEIRKAELVGDVILAEELPTIREQNVVGKRAVLSALNVMQAALNEGVVKEVRDIPILAESLVTKHPSLKIGLYRSFGEAMTRMVQAAQKSPQTRRG